MAYFKINEVDFSNCVSGLKVSKSNNYKSQTNAKGDSVVDYINSKIIIEVNIIPLDNEKMASLQAAINSFNVQVSFRNPEDNTIKTINCIIPNNEVEYHTIQVNRVLFKAFNLTFTEL